MTIGTVKFFNSTRGFGFIEPEDGSKDAFVHISAVERAGLTGLTEGQRVEYELQQGNDGKSSAEDLKLLDGRGLKESPAGAGQWSGFLGPVQWGGAGPRDGVAVRLGAAHWVD